MFENKGCYMKSFNGRWRDNKLEFIMNNYLPINDTMVY